MQLDTAFSPRRQLTGLIARLGHAIARAANGVMEALITLAETSGRVRELKALQSKSDTELARMGLRREDLVHYVFRDNLV